jgi:hypothetical protein
MNQKSLEALTWKHSADYKALRKATVSYLKEVLPDLTDDDFNPQDGIGLDEQECVQWINALSLCLKPPAREMPGLIDGTYFIFVQTTEISSAQIREVSSLVSDCGYSSIWVLGGLANTAENRSAALVCEDDYLVPSLLVAEKKHSDNWVLSSIQIKSLVEAAVQTKTLRYQ